MNKVSLKSNTLKSNWDKLKYLQGIKKIEDI